MSLPGRDRSIGDWHDPLSITTLITYISMLVLRLPLGVCFLVAFYFAHVVDGLDDQAQEFDCLLAIRPLRARRESRNTPEIDSLSLLGRSGISSFCLFIFPLQNSITLFAPAVCYRERHWARIWRTGALISKISSCENCAVACFKLVLVRRWADWVYVDTGRMCRLRSSAAGSPSVRVSGMMSAVGARWLVPSIIAVV